MLIGCQHDQNSVIKVEQMMTSLSYYSLNSFFCQDLLRLDWDPLDKKHDRAHNVLCLAKNVFL